MDEPLVPTPAGPARISWFEPEHSAPAVVVLGHGSATGIESADLQAVASALPPRDIAVALVTQPYRLSGSVYGSDEASLDVAWRHVWPHVAQGGMPVIAAGRSAGSQVACRTAVDLGALGALALSYPLLGPGSPQELLATSLPMLSGKVESTPTVDRVSFRRSRPKPNSSKSPSPTIRPGYRRDEESMPRQPWRPSPERSPARSARGRADRSASGDVALRAYGEGSRPRRLRIRRRRRRSGRTRRTSHHRAPRRRPGTDIDPGT